MTFPLINNIYEYKGKQYVMWQQDLFNKVYLYSIVNTGGAEYILENWWKFMLNAKKIGTLKVKNDNY